MPKSNNPETLFLKHYLSDLYTTEAERSEIEMAQLMVKGVQTTLKQRRIEVFDEEKNELFTLNRAGKAVMRWTDSEVIKKLLDLKLNYLQIKRIHYKIVGNEGNVLGHSENIYNCAIECRLPIDAILGFYTHDFGELLLLLKQLRCDYKTETKTEQQRYQEKKDLIEVYQRIGFSEDLIYPFR